MTDAVCIGVAGGTGSGKTTVADHIVRRIGAERIAYLQHDSYYLDLTTEQRADVKHYNFDHPDALDTDLLVRHIKKLRAGRAIEVPIYDYTIHARSGRVRRVEPRTVILVEGILIFTEKSLREQFDIKIFVDTDADLRFIRRLRRDIHERARSVDSVIDQYLDTVRPAHLEFVEPTKRYADVIFPEGGHNTVALDLVCARIQALADVVPA